MRMLKQSTAANIMVLMVDSTDHVTGKTGLTLTITASKDGGSFNSITPTVTERGSGWYNLALTTAHTDTLGDLAIHITSTGADPSDFYAWVIVRHMADLAWPATTGRSLTVESDGMVYADTREWVGSAPSALQTGRVDAYAGAMASGVIDSAAIATGAIDADAIAAGAITSSEAPALANLDAAVSTRASETGGNLSTVLGRVIGTIATGTHEPQSGDAFARVGIAGAGLTALGDVRIANLDATVGSRAPESDTNDIQGRLPAVLIGGRIDATVGAMQTDVVTAGSIAAGAITSSEAPALANLDATVSSRAVAGDSMALTSAAVDAVLDEVVEGTMTFRQMLRIFLSALALKSAGGGTATISFRDQADAKNRISVTVDSSNNRTAIGTLDGT